VKFQVAFIATVTLAQAISFSLNNMLTLTCPSVVLYFVSKEFRFHRVAGFAIDFRCHLEPTRVHPKASLGMKTPALIEAKQKPKYHYEQEEASPAFLTFQFHPLGVAPCAARIKGIIGQASNGDLVG
jgi:hypothetical protein